MKPINEMTKRELKKEYEAIIQQIEDIGCYGMQDLLLRGLLEREIANRGMEIRTITKVV